MSNMQKPINVPAEVSVEVASQRVKVKGPLGETECALPALLEAQYDPARRSVGVSRRGNDRHSRSLHGLYRSMIANMVEGVSKGFQKAMEIHGTGYNVNVRGRDLVLQVGFCHEVIFEVPEGIQVEIEQNAAQPDKPATFRIKGVDKERIGQFAAEIRAIRPPEPYKGKGIRYAGEHVRRKEGKALAGLD